jgi:hypothetical protein
VVAGASESDERGKSAAPEPFPEPVVNDDGGSGRGEVLPMPGVKDNHRSGMKEFFLESDACDGGGSGYGEVSPAFSIKVRVSASQSLLLGVRCDGSDAATSKTPTA